MFDSLLYKHYFETNRKKCVFFSMKHTLLMLLFTSGWLGAQSALVEKNEAGIYRLTSEGGAYFAEISLNCTSKYDMSEFPSFHGCYDWHSSVHNHWCLIRLLKKFPNLPQRDRVLERLRFSLSMENILQEVNRLKTMDDGWYVIPVHLILKFTGK